MISRSVPPMKFPCVDVETVTSLVTSLGVHKATGVDGLSVRFLDFLRLLPIW